MSFKKLHDILNPTYTSNKDQDKSESLNNKPRFPEPNQAVSPSSNPRSEYPNASSLYTFLPKNQNIFFNPTATSHHEVPIPSPMIQFPLDTKSKGALPGYLAELYIIPETCEDNSLNNKNKYNEASTYFHSNFHQPQPGSTQQPKNLQELLQRSSSSVPSNSPFQASFHSVMPSPFLSHSTPNSHFCTSTASKINKHVNSNILGTPAQYSRVLQEKNINAYQSNELKTHTFLVNQIDPAQGKENEVIPESMLTEILIKLRSLGLLPDKIIEKYDLIKSVLQNEPHSEKSPQQHYYKNQILHLLSSPKYIDIQVSRSEDDKSEFTGQITGSRIRLLDAGMIQGSNTDITENEENEWDNNSTKIKSWTKKHSNHRSLRRRDKPAGKKPRIKGKFISLEEYMEYRGIKTDDSLDSKSIWHRPFLGDGIENYNA